MQAVEFVDQVLTGAPETVWIPRGEGSTGTGTRWVRGRLRTRAAASPSAHDGTP